MKKTFFMAFLPLDPRPVCSSAIFYGAVFLSGRTRPAKLHFFRCTSNNDIAAGVTPAIRDACPTVAGRCAASFCRTSVDKPRTPL